MLAGLILDYHLTHFDGGIVALKVLSSIVSAILMTFCSGQDEGVLMSGSSVPSIIKSYRIFWILLQYYINDRIEMNTRNLNIRGMSAIMIFMFDFLRKFFDAVQIFFSALINTIL